MGDFEAVDPSGDLLLERLKASPLSQAMAVIRADAGGADVDQEARAHAHLD